MFDQVDVVMSDMHTMPSDQAELESHVQANTFLFSALLCTAAGGTAHATVQKYEKTEDGCSAYFALKEMCDDQGSKVNTAVRAYEILSNIRPDRKTPGGAEWCTSTFEAKTQELEEAGIPCHPLMRKISYLAGIVDPAYASIPAILESDHTKSYDDCIREVRHHDTTELTHQMHRRQSHTSRSIAPVINQDQVQRDLRHLPTDLWNSLSKEQRDLWLRHARNVKNKNMQADASGPPKQCMRTANMVHQEEDISDIIDEDTERSEASGEQFEASDSPSPDNDDEVDIADFVAHANKMTAQINAT